MAHSTAPSLQVARTPRAVRRAAWLLVLFVAGAVPLLLLAPWTQTVHGLGRAVAFDPLRRPQPVVSPIQGRILTWHGFKEGDRVKAGDKLVDLRDNDEGRLDMLIQQRGMAEQRKSIAKSVVLEQGVRVRSVEADVRARVAAATARREVAETAIIVNKQQLLIARADEDRAAKALKRAAKLFNASGAGSENDYEEAERNAIRTRENVPLAQALIKIAEKTFAAAEQEVNALTSAADALVSTEKQALERARSEEQSVGQQYNLIDSDVKRQENQSITAGVTGRLFRVLTNAEGQFVNAGAQLAVVVPDINPAGSAKPLTADGTPGIVAELLIDGNDLPLVRKGDRALVQFEGWAAVQFAAYPEAAAGTFEGRVYLVDPTSDAQGRFRILVEPAPGADWPDEEFLRQGVRAQGWIIAAEVRLGYELWRLLNGFPPAREVKSKESRQVFGGGPVGK